MILRLFVPAVVVYAVLNHQLLGLALTQGRLRSGYFSLYYGMKHEHPSCQSVAAYSHLSCAMACLDNSSWVYNYLDDDDFPLCEICSQYDASYLRSSEFGIVGMSQAEVRCPKPPHVTRAKVSVQSRAVGAVASYSCRPDSTYISGDWTSWCLPDGTWTHVDLKCVETGCYSYDWRTSFCWYDGKVSVTQSGFTCQNWAEDVPHKRSHTVVKEMLTAMWSTDNNYCRPYAARTPWCYTTDPDTKWDVCRIPRCSHSPWMVPQHLGKPFTLHHINRALRMIPDRCLKTHARSLCVGKVLKCVLISDEGYRGTYWLTGIYIQTWHAGYRCTWMILITEPCHHNRK